MKILIDARMYGLENAGIGRYLINLIAELKDIKFDGQITLLLTSKYFNYLDVPINWKKIEADFRHYTFREQFNLPGIIKRENPDLVHFPHINTPLFWNGKFVLTMHDLTMQKQGRAASKLPLLYYLFKRTAFLLNAKFAVKRAVKIITPSNSVAEDLSNYYEIDKNRIQVIYEGVKADFFTYVPGKGEIDTLSKNGLMNKDYFFYVGNAYPHKNLESVVKAIADVNINKNKNVIFVIAGSRDVFTKRLESTIRNHKAGEFIKLLGFVNDADLKYLYKNSLGFIYPSLAEGFGLQGLEAIASGTIVLCSNIPVFKEIYEDHAFYFNPKDIDSISSTIYSVANIDKSDKQRYLETAQGFIKKYSWKKTAEETFKLYNSI